MGEIYLLQCDDAYKIGVSKNTKKRIKQLQTGNKAKIAIIHIVKTSIPYKIEAMIHNLWSHKKYIIEDFTDLEGEWFQLTNQDINKFVSICREYEANHKLIKEMGNPFI